ncbi:hypothetical protein [Spongiimicrobium sp. 3-5]|uniref:hypothetical protein n=1 Tax=Spongiimicrobium sp. 3-5 TaxID=3332596 RepID=UPI003980979E
MSDAIVQRGDWKNLPMPKETSSFLLNKKISNSEYEQLILGIRPRQMEDKWFAFVENNTLFFHRSPTGFCIYETLIEQTSQGYLLAKTRVNRNSEQYDANDNAEDKIALSYLIDRFLLGKAVTLKRPTSSNARTPNKGTRTKKMRFSSTVTTVELIIFSWIFALTAEDLHKAGLSDTILLGIAVLIFAATIALIIRAAP